MINVDINLSLVFLLLIIKDVFFSILLLISSNILYLPPISSFLSILLYIFDFFILLHKSLKSNNLLNKFNINPISCLKLGLDISYINLVAVSLSILV